MTGVQTCAIPISKVFRKSPEIVNPNQVHIVEIGDSIGDSYEVVGTVNITDKLLTARCGYDYVINLAKNETSKNGGNALALRKHKKPDIWSTCHRIEGVMLVLDEIPGSEGENVSGKENVNLASYVSPQKKHQYNTFYVNLGYSYIYSDIYMADGASGNPKNGFEWQLGYDRVFRRGMGFGFLCAGYRSSFEIDEETAKLDLIYFAPQFVLKQRLGNWQLRESAGFGYFNYRESIDNLSGSMGGVGTNINMNCEYLVTDNFGVGVNFGYITGIFPQGQSELPDDVGIAGISRMFINAGIRWHF